MSPMLILNACGAALVVALGLMLLAVSSLVVGGVVSLIGGVWFAWCLRRA